MDANPSAGAPHLDEVGDLGRKLIGTLTRKWWVLLLRGIAAISFGVLAWFWPGLTLATMVLLFGAFALTDGALGLWGAITGPKNEHRWVLALWGVVGIGVGALTLVAPQLVAASLVLVIAVWAIAKGIFEIMAAIRLRREIEGEWFLIAGGVASVAFGLLLAARPGVGVRAFLWVIALYAVLFGLVLVVLAFKVRGFGKRLS